MKTVFSHIVQKRLSQESENVATLALEFVLNIEAARNGMMKLLRGVVPQLPPRLWFRTQQIEDGSRPDMWGNDAEGKPHVFVENKFWAGLTENQPISYLRILAERTCPTILLVIVPEARKETVWSELKRKLDDSLISTTEKNVSAGIVHNVTTNIGPGCPILALTSWKNVLSFLMDEVADDRSASSDLLQLRALCEAVESDAFVPFSSGEVSSNLRTPALALQLISIVQAVVQKAADAKVLTLVHGSFTAPRIGRYAGFNDRNCGMWLGIDFTLWKKYERSPLWLSFSTTEWGRAHEVQALLEPWAEKNGVFTASQHDDFIVAMDLPVGEEKDTVVSAVVKRLKQIADVLTTLKPQEKKVIPVER